MILAALLLAQANPFDQFHEQVAIFGVGRYSCAKAWQPENHYASFAWVMGYVSGRNYSDATRTGVATAGEGIVADIKRRCELDPSALLVNVTERAFTDLRKLKR